MINKIVELPDECMNLRRHIHYQKRLYKRKLFRLSAVLHSELNEFQNCLIRCRGSLDHKKYEDLREYVRSYELLAVLFEQTLRKVSSTQLGIHLPTKPKASDPEIWQEYYDTLYDSLKDFERSSDLAYRSYLIKILELSDAIERLKSLDYPDSILSDQKSINYLAGIGGFISQIHHNLYLALRRRRVKLIHLSPGDYPPIDTTEVVSNFSNGHGDRLVVESIVEHGYFFRDSILRKAKVIVTYLS